MPYTTSYTEAQRDLAQLLDRVINDREVITITRQGSQDVVLIAADEFENLLETAHLLRSPKNAELLYAALERSERGEGETMTVEELKKRVGFDSASQ